MSEVEATPSRVRQGRGGVEASAPIRGIDKSGNQRWYGEYPSIWLSDADLLAQVRSHLAS